MNHPPQQETFPNPWGWPAEVLPAFQRYLTVEHATLTAKGQPLTYPLSPYLGEDGRTLQVSTGLTYPAKAERVRRNPKTCLLYSDTVGSGLAHAPIVLVYGLGAVRDADLQTNTDRYVKRAGTRNMIPPLPAPILRRMQWYLARLWVEITPVRILWWPDGDLDAAPRRWEIPAGQGMPASDPAPAGAVPPRWKEKPADIEARARYALANLGVPVLTTVDAEGFPVPVRTRSVQSAPGGFRLEIGRGVPVPAAGPACLTFHQHPEKFTGQENMVFVGSVGGIETGADAGQGATFTIDHCPGDWSLPPRGMGAILSFIGNGWKLSPRLKAEAQRRNQPVPKINL